MSKKEDFKEWLKDNVKSGAPLSAYPNAIESLIPKKLIELGESKYANLFDCEDIIYLKDLSKRLLRGGDLHTYNVNTQARLPSAAINQYIKFLEFKNKKEFKIKESNIKNIMLYGAPGVGKTHNYKRIITMIENGNDKKTIFNTISSNDSTESFNEDTLKKIKNDKRIEFVTFHQSYSYEDFIEGFRPNENTHIELEDGIFKKIAQVANENLKNSKIDIKKDNINVDELIVKFTNYIQDSLDNNKEFSLEKKVTIEGINDKNAFLLGGSIKSAQRLTPDIIKRDYEEFKKGNISKYEDIKPTRESKSLYHGNARYYYMLYKKIYEFEKSLNFSEIKQEKVEEKNFYIVIDEINRGNISKIFGELITLIEEDKRDNYEVTLPYSKEKFKIPSNLYIIATMNSTDKSIATIDIALRRRFTFLKMKANIYLVPDIAKELFEKLNEHITKVINEDYKLGHSYFMTIENEEDFRFVKKYKIKPLLEEYFYGDEKNYNEAIEILGLENE